MKNSDVASSSKYNVFKKSCTYIKNWFKEGRLRFLISKFQKNLFYKYISLLLVVMLVPTVFGCLTSYLCIKVAKNQIIEKNNQVINYIQSSIDSNLKYVVEHALETANNENLLEFSKKPYSREFIYDASTMQFFPMNASPSINDLVYRQAIFLDSSDTVISRNYVYHVSTYFEESLRTRDISYNDFYQIVKDTSSRKVIPAMGYYSGNRTTPHTAIMYVQPFPLSSAPRGNILVFINCKTLFSSFEERFNNDNACFFIIDQNGEIIYSIGNDKYISKDYAAKGDSGTLKIDGKEVLFSKKSASYAGLRYICVENTNTATKDVLPLFIITIIYALMTLVVGTPLIIWLARKNTMPIREINQMLGSSGETDDTENELRHIQSAVKNILDEKIKTLPILEAGEVSMRKKTISNLLHGEFNNVESILKACEKNGIEFSSDDFCVIYFNLNEILKPDIQIIKYAISNIVSEIFEPISNIFIDDTEPSSLAGILNLKALVEDTEKQIISHLEFLRNFFTEQFSAAINVGVGSTVKGVENISSSYSNAKDAAEYSILTGTSDVLPYSRIKNKDYYYFYPLETESKLVSSVMNGDIEQVTHIIDHIVEANSMLSFDMYKCLFFDLTATALKIMSNKTIDTSYIFDGSSSPISNLINCKNIKELVETIHGIFNKICEHTKGGYSMRKEKLKSSILEFIHKNFTNPNMSLAMVADEFSMNYTYMSHFFKDFIGMNFIDYVSDLRVKKASELLRTTNMSISDIAFAVGYANSTVLIKIFKKITNTTPGAYRRNSN